MSTHYRSQNGRPKSGRPQKPGLLKRHSATAVQKVKTVQIQDDRDDTDGLAQYCATCEKQIVTPSHSILYCSESCRRKDRTRIPTYDDFTPRSPPLSPLQTSSSFEKFSDIVPQRSPTAVHIPRNRYSYSSFSEDETVYSEDEKHPSPRRESEAEKYLRQFTEHHDAESRTPRPLFNRSSTGYSMSNVPSLSHSPTSTAAGMSYQYTRPLPPRQNPYSTSFKFSKSIDLVNPFPAMTQIVPKTQPASTTAPSSPRAQQSRFNFKSGAGAATSQGVADGDINFTRSSIPMSTSGPESGSLKGLFRFQEMQAPPQQFERF